MKRVLLDTNIIIDIAKRSEFFFEHSSKVFGLAVEEKIIAYISASAATDIFYILQKENGLDFLVTRNTKDFTKLKGIKVLTPLEFLEAI
jgi:predicted nucleic acid-binding protein